MRAQESNRFFFGFGVSVTTWFDSTPSRVTRLPLVPSTKRLGRRETRQMAVTATGAPAGSPVQTGGANRRGAERPRLGSRVGSEVRGSLIGLPRS
jgi:hypothetical protein